MRPAAVAALALVAALLCGGGAAGAAEAGQTGPLAVDRGDEPEVDGGPADEARHEARVQPGRQRLVRHFDFHEPDNFEDMPRDWYALGREADTAEPGFHRMPLHNLLIHRGGFPPYNEVRFDRPPRESEDNRLYLGLDGGSAGAFLAVGAVTALPRTDYMVTARVRTDRLEHARARLSGFFVDQRGRRIESSISRSELIDTGGQWATLQLQLAGDHPAAAWIGLKAELLQPRHQRDDATADQHRPQLEDVEGSAWFDDIAIWQMPRIILRTQNPVNIIRDPQRPRVEVEVRDSADQLLHATVTVYDADSRPVAWQQRTIGGSQPRQWQWQPPLDAYGWYLVDLVLRERNEQGRVVGRSVLAMLHLPNDPALSRSERRRFILDAQHLDEAQLPLVPQVMADAGLLSVMLSAWDQDTTLDSIEQRCDLLDEVIARLGSAGIEVGLGLDPVPTALAEAVHADQPSALELLMRPRRRWDGFVGPVLRRWGQRIHRWQVGSVHEPTAFDLPDLPAAASRARRELGSLAPDVRLIVPWSARQARWPGLEQPLRWTVQLPRSIQPSHIGAAVEPLVGDADGQQAGGDGAAAVTLALEAAPATELTHRRRIADLARRMVHAWEQPVEGLSLSRPWTAGLDRELILLPDPLLGVYAQVARRLEGRRVIGWMPVGEGMRCAILDGPAGPMLAVWNDSAPAARAMLDMHLGPRPVAIDVWGNRRPVASVDGRHRLAVGQTPLFVEGIDAQLALFRASLRIEEAFVESNHQVQSRTVHVSNPWPRTLTGSFRFVEPAEDQWRIQPRVRQFSIAAGRSAAFDVQLQLFPRLEPAGTRPLHLRFDFRGEQEMAVDVALPIEVGLREVELDANLTLEPGSGGGGPDAVVMQTVTNRGDRVLSLRAFATLPGYSRQEDPIPQLMPGQTMVRRFRFRDAMDALGRHPIRTGITLDRGAGTLHKVLSLDGD